MTLARLVCIVGVVAAAIGEPARAQTAAEAPAAVATPEGLAWRSRGGELTLLPGGRLQVDGAFFPKQNPKSGLFIRRARVELRGWVGDAFYFDVGGDFAPGPPAGAQIAPNLWPAADNFLAYAPFGDALIVQAGQFDVPFTLENRTSDTETDFIERAMTARTLGAPRNKDVGAMVHGLVADGRFYYSAGLFNGEGPGFRNFDNQADAIGRLVWAPFADGDVPWRRVSLGASAWHGNHVLGPEAPVQATPGGVVFFQPSWTLGAASPGVALHEQGAMEAFGGELNLPLGPRFGMRGELVWKKQHLSEGTEGASGFVPVGTATLDGIAGYGELWFWVLGDQGLLAAPGFELPLRMAPATRPLLDDGLMVAIRGEFLKEDLNSDTPTLGDPAIATTRVVSGTAGLNYWRGRFIRLSANYVLQQWSGTSETVQTLRAAGKWEHELLLRFALAL
ncbi:MAG: porin [Polyangia bacterium]